MSDTAMEQKGPQALDSLVPVRADVIARLCIMMFLEFFVWGAWYVTTSTYMTQVGMASDIGLAYLLCPIGAIIAPFFLGMIADRFFASERVLGVLHILGGAFMLLVPSMAAKGSGPFLLLILCHALCYMPTLGLTNTIAFHHITNQEKQFPLIRVFGTLGWIAAGMLIGFLGVAKIATPFIIAGWAAIALGVISFGLPHTPPPAKGKKASIGEILGVDALKLFKSRSFTVFAISSFLICIPLAAYYNFAGRMTDDILLDGYAGTVQEVGTDTVTIKEGTGTVRTIAVDKNSKILVSNEDSKPPIKNQTMSLADFKSYMDGKMEAKPKDKKVSVTPPKGAALQISSPPAATQMSSVMTIGQWAEVIFMLIMPWFFLRLGVKWMLGVGMLAWVLRYALFAAGAPASVFWMIVLGISFHGMCYDFFFVTGFIYTDRRASKEIRGQAQGLLVLLTQGLGLGLGALIAGKLLFNPIVGAAEGATALPKYQMFWAIPCLFALVVLVVFMVLFKDDSKEANVAK